jgi:hypothetical protein
MDSILLLVILMHGYGGIIPPKPFLTLIRLSGYPYPSLWVRVLAGTGEGMKKKPRGYPGHTLATGSNPDMEWTGNEAG